MRIYEFVRNDEIVRTRPAKFGDRSYIGDKLIFLGIANGCIYCKRTDPLDIAILGDKPLSLPLDAWENDWDYYFDPSRFVIKDIKLGR